MGSSKGQTAAIAPGVDTLKGRPVVWGLGRTVKAAEAEAKRWLEDYADKARSEGLAWTAPELRFVRISDEQAAAIVAGDVDATDYACRGEG